MTEPSRTVLWVPLLLAAAGCERAGPPPSQPRVVLTAQPAVQPPGPPTTLSLVLQMEPDGRLHLVSAHPKHGSPSAASAEEHQADLLAGRVRLVEYVARDSARRVLAAGTFLLPTIAVSEFQDLAAETRIRRTEEPLARPSVTLSVPYRAGLATVGFVAAVADSSAAPADWRRAPLGEVSIPRQQTPGQSPPSR